MISERLVKLRNKEKFMETEDTIYNKQVVYDELHRMASYMNWVCGMFFLY